MLKDSSMYMCHGKLILLLPFFSIAGLKINKTKRAEIKTLKKIRTEFSGLERLYL